MGLIRTGKMLPEETVKALDEEYRAARNTPVILFSQSRLDPNGKDEATLAMEAFHRNLNRACVAAGFPEPEKDADGDVINYGLDFRNGEVVTWDGQP